MTCSQIFIHPWSLLRIFRSHDIDLVSLPTNRPSIENLDQRFTENEPIQYSRNDPTVFRYRRYPYPARPLSGFRREKSLTWWPKFSLSRHKRWNIDVNCDLSIDGRVYPIWGKLILSKQKSVISWKDFSNIYPNVKKCTYYISKCYRYILIFKIMK